MKPSGLKSTSNVSNKYVLLNLLKHNHSTYVSYLETLIEQQMPQRFLDLITVEIEKLESSIKHCDNLITKWEIDNAMPPSI